MIEPGEENETSDELEKEEDEATREDQDKGEEGEETERTGRFARLRRRLLDRRELTDDAKHLIGSALETSDWARKEFIRLLGREVRSYLEALELKEDLLNLVQSHSLEINASFYLKPLEHAEEDKPDKDDPPTEDEGEE